jgi:hypothetical protein
MLLKLGILPFWPQGWVKNQDSDPGSGSGLNNPDHSFESLETTFWVNFFDADPGSGMEKI